MRPELGVATADGDSRWRHRAPDALPSPRRPLIAGDDAVRYRQLIPGRLHGRFHLFGAAISTP